MVCRFPATIFFTFGGFWGTFGATLTPFYDAVNGYGNDPAGFYNSFAMFLIGMAILCFFFAIAALRTNVCLVFVLVCFCVTFPCLAASYFYLADGVTPLSNTCRVVGAAFAFAATMVTWYLVSLQTRVLSTSALLMNRPVVLHDPGSCGFSVHAPSR